MPMRDWLRILPLAVVFAAAVLRAGELAPAFVLDDIDLAQCRATVDAQEVSRPTGAALATAFFGAPGDAVWSTGKQSGPTRHLVVTFTRPVALGTVCAPDFPGTEKQPLQAPAGNFVSILRPEARYPGDPANEADWLLLRPGAVKTLPPSTVTRALRLSEVCQRPFGTAEPRETVLPRVVCLRDRYYDANELGSSARRQRGDSEETVFASWLEPLPVAGLMLHGSAVAAARVAWLAAASSFPAPRAPADDWQATTAAQRPLPDLLVFAPPATTRALRVTAPLRNRRSTLLNVLPLIALGDAELSPGTPRPPPFTIPFAMPLAGFAAIDIHDRQSGRLVRRLIAETPRDQGPVQEPWDLRDNAGQIVPPGEYAWRGLALPPLQRIYELTLYNAGQPPWRAPAPEGHGGGMWLADHVAPSSAAAQADLIWLGAFVAENGHSLIATDLEGRKLWGTESLSLGFRGPSRIAVDERCAYALTNSIVYRVDPRRDFKARSIFSIASTAERPWNVGNSEPQPELGGLAARDGKLYVAINLPNQWLASSFIADTLDPAASEPSVRLYKNGGRKRANEKVDKVYGFGRYDELMGFYAAFMTDRMPKETLSYPGVALTCNGESWFGDAPSAGANRGRLVAVFREPVTVGSILVPDGAVQVQVLKPGVPARQAVSSAADAPAKHQTGLTADAAEPGGPLGDLVADLDAESDSGIWQTLPNVGGAGRPTVALAPAGGLKTLALRFKTKRLPFTQVMAHRLTDVAARAERLCGEGQLTPTGGVRFERRGQAVTELQPALMALRWPEPQELRGLSLIRIGEGQYRPQLPARIAIDKWIGTGSDVQAGLQDHAAWEEILVATPAPDATVCQADFGQTVRAAALRLRFLSGTEDRLQKGTYLSGCEALVAYAPAGGDPEDLPANMSQRLAVLQLPAPADDEGQATVVADIPLARPNALAFDAQGVLHCLADGQIVTVPLAAGQSPRVVVPRERLETPVHFCFGPDGLLYLTDKGPKVVKVFDPQSGALRRSIGTPGGPRPGAWDPLKLENPAQVAVDRNGRIWVADFTVTPKRIMVFNADGTAYKWFLGPTQYGGGGYLDPGDRNIVMYNGMKFRIDWERRTWNLEALLGENVERPIYSRGRRYLVGPFPGPGKLCQITIERDQVAIPVAAAGNLGSWPALRQHPALRQALGGLNPETTSIVWSDQNADGIPQPAEVQTLPNRPRDNWDVGEDLSFFSIPPYSGDGICLRPSAFNDAGIPRYELRQALPVKPASLPSQTRRAWGDEQGRFFLTGTRLLAADGVTKLWEYPSPYTVHAGFYNTPFRHQRPPGVLSQEHFPIAHFRVGGEEFFVTNSDPGDWYCYTADGMLAGCLFGGPRGYGLKTWPPRVEPGKTVLDDLRLAQEHYQGCVVAAADGKVYAVAGHNHMSIVRIEGLERLQRLAGTIAVTAADLERTRAWQAREDLLARTRSTPKVATMLRADTPPAITGTLEEWPEEIFVTIAQTVKPSLSETITYLDSKGAIGYDARNLYLAMQVRDESPLRNSAQDPKTLFKGGDAADLALGLDPGADPKRQDAVAGDLRLLFALVKGQPVVTLYRPVDPQAPAETRTTFESPVGRIHLDRVQEIRNAKVAVKTTRYKQLKDRITMDGLYWTLEAAIPWAALGVAPPAPDTVLRGDFGYLQSDDQGTRTVSREYWSGKSQTVVADTPSEARLQPALWGQFVVTRPDQDLRFAKPVSMDAPGLLEGKPAPSEAELLNGLDE